MKSIGIRILSVLVCVIGLYGFKENISPQSASTASNQQYENEITQWYTHRVEGLKKEYGWLSLIELKWLNEGKNKIPSIGEITIKNNSIAVTVSNDVQASLNKKPFHSGTLKANDDRVIIGSKAFMVIERDGKYALRMWDAESARRKQFHGIERFPVNQSWRIIAEWKEYKTVKKVEIETVIPGITEEAMAPGIALFEINGKKFQLEPTAEDSLSDYFFVFGDKSNGKESYGGGRFLYAERPKNGKIILDFNKSYNPPCAFTEFATCPIPLPKNKLSIRIDAGEKKVEGH